MRPIGAALPIARLPSIRREILTQNRTYYVATTGNDNNSGLSVDTPFLSIQKAVDVACNTLDSAGYTITIQLADGTYNQAVSVSWNGLVKALVIAGNAAHPENVVIYYSNSSVIAASGSANLTLKDFSVYMSGTTEWNGCIYVAGAAIITFSGIRFGAVAPSNCFHLLARAQGNINASGNYAIYGGAAGHVDAEESSRFSINSKTITITNTPAFSTAFITSTHNSVVTYGGNSFSGSATGKRYSAVHHGCIDAWGGGSTYLPGNSAGTTANYGLYI